MNFVKKSRKSALIVFIFLLSLILVSCSSGENIEEYAVVKYETDFMGRTTGRIIFGNNSENNKHSTVYHYNSKNKTLQLQPSKIGDTITNVNSDWKDVKSIESLGMKTVYYLADDYIGLDDRYRKINVDDIEVYKITRHLDYGNTIHISEIFVIDIKDIEAFEFNYKVKELE